MANTKKKATVKKSAKTTKTSKKMSKDIKLSAKTSKSSSALRTSTKFLDELKLSESYVSLLLGVVVVLILSAVFFLFVKGVAFNNSDELTAAKPLPSQTTLQSQRTYTLKEGEGLWDVAVKYYGDGYKWVEIAKANNLTEEQANALGPGAKIIVPNLK